MAAVPAPPEVETPAPLDPEAVPPPAQEPELPEEAPESGAPEVEEEASDPSALLAELVKEHPELLTDDLKRELGIKDEPTDLEELTKREAELESRERGTTYSAAANLAASYSEQNVWTATQNAISVYLDTAEAAMKKAAESGEAQDLPSAEQLARQVYTLAMSGISAWTDWGDKLAKTKAMEAVAPYTRYLTRDERTKLRAAEKKPLAEFFGEVQPIVADALLRAAPDEFKKQTKAQIEKELSVAEKVERLRAGLGKNGKGRTGTAAPTNTYGTKMEARTLHVQGKITNAEMKRINADPSTPEM